MQLPTALRPGWIALIAVVLIAPATHSAEVSSAIDRMKKDLYFLAGDECEGRGPETAGINKAADYIVKALKDAGVKPGMPDGTYFQNFEIGGKPVLRTPNSVALKGPLGQTVELAITKHFGVCGLSNAGKLDSEIVFAGYGITTRAAKGEKPAYDDYAGLDVKGKIVVVLRKTPRPDNRTTPFAAESNSYAPLITKIENAEAHGAAAVFFVNDRSTIAKSDDLMPFEYAAEGGRSTIPAFHIRRAVLEQMLSSSTARSLNDIEMDIDRDLKPQSTALKGWTASVQASVERPQIQVKNIVAVLEGKGPLANETVVIGAHYDHLGRGDSGSLSPGSKAIHFGADDNGSGSTAILEMARRFAALKDREGRRLVFIWFTAEERGLVGSAHYCTKPVFPLKDTVAMINLDMVGRVRPDAKTKKDKMEIGGIGTAKTFEAQIDALNKKYDFDIKKTRSGFGPSDHTSFYRKQVPVFFYFSGMHAEYHRPTDTPDRVNYEGMDKVVAMVSELTNEIASAKDRPVYVNTGGGMMSLGGGGEGPRLGFMPAEYNEDEIRGVPVGAISKDGPAEKAGIKDGDWIVELAGQPIKNMAGYMRVKAGLKPGETVEIVVTRDDKKVKLKVTPQ